MWRHRFGLGGGKLCAMHWHVGLVIATVLDWNLGRNLLFLSVFAPRVQAFSGDNENDYLLKQRRPKVLLLPHQPFRLGWDIVGRTLALSSSGWNGWNGWNVRIREAFF